MDKEEEEKTKLWLYCPEDTAHAYIAYMQHRNIEFREDEAEEGQRCFVIDKKFRPHQWVLDI